jgi:fucose permease
MLVMLLVIFGSAVILNVFLMGSMPRFFDITYTTMALIKTCFFSGPFIDVKEEGTLNAEQ